MSAPRIDTLHRTIDSVIVRLDELWPDIADLHDLAYVRHKAATSAKVRGGAPDYALDTHGDPEARTLLTKISLDLIDVGRAAERDLKEVRRYLNRDAGRAKRRDRTSDVTPYEFISARYALGRRKVRGERHPHLIVAQPERKPAVDPVMELEALRAAVRRMVPRFEDDHQGCTDEDGKRKTRRMDRSLLSAHQREAWDRALADVEEAAAS